jgi:ribosome-associated translation inhibitor RaiA
MDIDSLHAHIEHQTADLRTLYPQIKDCHSAMIRWKDEGGEERYSLRLDIRWPQHQTIVSGESKDSARAAIAAAFDTAREKVHQAGV